MIRNFFSTPNVLGRLMIVLLLAGGLVFAGAFNGFVVESQASGCCGSGTDTITASDSGSHEDAPGPAAITQCTRAGKNNGNCKLSGNKGDCNKACVSKKLCNYNGC